MKLADIAKAVGGTVEGADGEIAVKGVAALQDAEAGDIAFLANPRYAPLMKSTRASAVVVSEQWHGESGAALIRVTDPDMAFAKIAAMLAPPPPTFPLGVHETAVVAKDAVLGVGVSVGPHAVVESGTRIGDRTRIGAGVYIGHAAEVGNDCVLHPHVSLRERVILGDRVVVHNGAVIGSDGFGYGWQAGHWEKIPQVGIVEIGDDVEIGANATIDRARFGKTVIGRGVKIDNLVQIAHNVRIGDHTAIAAQAGIAGSTIIGRCCRLGGQAGITGHISIGDGAVVGAQAGVTKDVKSGQFVSGYPAMPHERALEAHAHVMRIPQLKARLAQLETEVERIRRLLEDTGGPH